MGYCLYRNKEQHNTDEARIDVNHYRELQRYNNASEIIKPHNLYNKIINIIRTRKLKDTSEIPGINNDVKPPANNV